MSEIEEVNDGFARINSDTYGVDSLGAAPLIAKLKDSGSTQVPVTDLSELKTESDVEQKLVYPFLSHPSFLGIPHEWIRTKEYMEPTEVDKRAGRRAGYIPDYSVWRTGFPLIVVEAKRPDVAVETALQEAQMYAARINARYPPNINPIGWVLASNGERFALAQADSQTDVLYALASDLRPGSDILGKRCTAPTLTGQAASALA